MMLDFRDLTPKGRRDELTDANMDRADSNILLWNGRKWKAIFNSLNCIFLVVKRGKRYKSLLKKPSTRL